MENEKDLTGPSLKWTLWDVAAVLVILLTVMYLMRLIRPLLRSLIYVGHDADPSQALFVGTLIQAAVMVLAVLLLIKRRGANFRDLGINRQNLQTNIVTGFGTGIVLGITVIIIVAIVSLVFGPPPSQEVETLLEGWKSGKDILLPFISIAVFAPVSEEIYFRGMAYPALKARFGAYFGILASAIFFASLHMDIYRLLPITIGGMGLAYIYEKTGSLVTSVVAHTTWNSLMLILLYLDGIK